jgi:uncharacterized protein YacL
MKKGQREYYKHFIIIALLVSSMIMLAYFHLAPTWLMQALIIVIFTYMLLFSVGLFFNAGPFKYIGRLYVQDRKHEQQEMRNKQPWE